MSILEVRVWSGPDYCTGQPGHGLEHTVAKGPKLNKMI